MQAMFRMNLQIKLKHQFVLLMAISILCACTSPNQEELQDRSILAETPCKAPCWQDIRIGESTEQDVLNILKKLEFIGEIKPDVTVYLFFLGDGIETPHKGIYAACKEPSEQTCALIAFEEDKVVAIILFPNYKITFNDFVQHVGNPDEVMFAQTSSPAICTVGLIWNHDLITATYNSKAGSASECDALSNTAQVDPDFEIFSILFSERPIDHTARIGKPQFFAWSGFIKP
jgi:hypothetical protein